MHKNKEKGKGELSTWLSYESRKSCRTFCFHKKIGQALSILDKIPYQFMLNNFFALSVVIFPTSSIVISFRSAICSATNLT